MSTSKELATLFSRDLAKLIQQIESFPDDESLWQVLPGVSNARVTSHFIYKEILEST